MIRCPKCTGNSAVIDSRPTGRSMRRRRRCENEKCQHSWSTYETPANFEIVLSAFDKIAGPLRSRLKALESELVELSRLMRMHVKHVRASGSGRTRRRRVPPELSRCRRWSSDDDAKLRELYPVLGPAKMAERLSRTRNSVQTRARQLGVHIDYSRRRTSDYTISETTLI